jgi:tetratricopeptide (TPR) repeat protein
MLQTLMDQAKDYDDFAEQLCERSLKDPVPELLTYFAFYHAFNQDKYVQLERLMEAQTGSDLTQPIELTYTCVRGEPVEWNDFQKVIDAALKMTKNDWMACHVYLAWRVPFEVWGVPESLTDNKPLDILESRIKNDEEYGFFLASLHAVNARRFAHEGNVEIARKWFDSAISLAKKFDDKLMLADLLQMKANIIKNVNASEALSILKVQKEVCDQIGYVAGLGYNAHTLGHIAMARGEYDAAIEYQNEYIRNIESRGEPVVFMKSVVASLYNQKGDGKRAMELITRGKKEAADYYPLLQESWALVNLDQPEEAFQSLHKAREIALKSGNEGFLGHVYLVEGLIQKKRHDFTSATFALDKALDIFERLQGLSFTNLALIHLTDVEIELYSYDKKGTKTNLSGPWMQRLLEQVEQRELPGIAAQAKLLQAKFHFKRGEIVQSRKMLKRVLKTSKTSSMHYLKDMAELVIPDLFVS